VFPTLTVALIQLALPTHPEPLLAFGACSETKDWAPNSFVLRMV